MRSSISFIFLKKSLLEPSPIWTGLHLGLQLSCRLGIPFHQCPGDSCYLLGVSYFYSWTLTLPLSCFIPSVWYSSILHGQLPKNSTQKMFKTVQPRLLLIPPMSVFCFSIVTEFSAGHKTIQSKISFSIFSSLPCSQAWPCDQILINGI